MSHPAREIKKHSRFLSAFFRFTRQTTKYLLCIILSDTAFNRLQHNHYQHPSIAKHEQAQKGKSRQIGRFLLIRCQVRLCKFCCANGKCVKNYSIFLDIFILYFFIRNRWREKGVMSKQINSNFKY